MPELIQINFSKTFPLFPLAGVCLLPHATVPIHIFEPRYIHMVNDAIDSSGQIALGTFEGEHWKKEYHGNPDVRPIVCLAQIEKHEKLPLGRFNVLLQGICRARIVDHQMPDSSRPYRLVQLEPLESNPEAYEQELADWRTRVRDLLEQKTLGRHRFRDKIVEWFDRDDIPSHVLIEILGHLMITTNEDAERRYELLQEPDARERAHFAERELNRLITSVMVVESQISDWPKGMSWN